MPNLIYGSSMTDPNYANYRGSQTYNFQPMASSQGRAVNAQGQPQINNPAPSGRGGGGGGDSRAQELAKMSRNPSQESEYQQLMQQGMQSQPQAPQIDFDAMIAPALADLDAFMGTQQGSYEGDVASANAWKGLQGEGVAQSLGAQQATIGAAKTQAGTAAESAADEAKRMYTEQQQGLQARYGKTTGTGQFASAQAGMATNRNIAGIRTKAMDLIAGFDDKLVQVKEVADLSLKEIDQSTQDQIKAAKDRLDQGMQQIRSQKTALVQHKAELAAQAVQIYQQTVAQVNASNAQFKQQLMMQQMQAENALTIAKQKANDVAANPVKYGFSTTTNPLGGSTLYATNPQTGEAKIAGGYNPGSGLNTTDLSTKPP